MIPKLVFNSSFPFGDVPLASLVQDPFDFRKSARAMGSSPVVEQWGKVDPVPGHTLVHQLALSSFEKTSANNNADGFEEWHLKEAHPTFVTHGALYKDHKSKGPKFGHIVKTAYNEPMGRVELLTAYDNDKCADHLTALERGDTQKCAISMGYHCDFDECSVCGHKAKNRSEYCQHTKRGALAPYGLNRILPDGRKVFVYNRSGHFNDISMVGTGADPIAFSLRKVAGLNADDTPSGADLAEAYGYGVQTDGAPDVRKVALARKLSMIEKRLEMAGVHSYQRRERHQGPLAAMPKEALQRLREVRPTEFFGELAKLGALLSPDDFFRYVFGSEYDANTPKLTKAARACRHAFSLLDGDVGFERLSRVCANSTYDAFENQRAPVTILKSAERAALVRSCALNPELSRQRAMEAAALSKVAAAENDSIGTTSDPAVDALVDQYAAYKLAALSAMETDDAALLAAVLES